jgi:DNA-binding XRE family transcriptional regulator
MTAPTNIKHQLIEHNGQPVAVVVPYDEYLKIIYPELNEPMTPHAVVKKIHLDGLTPIQAWREYLNLTQEEMAKRLGIKQSSYQQIEKKTARPRAATLEKVAAAFGIEPSLLT